MGVLWHVFVRASLIMMSQYDTQLNCQSQTLTHIPGWRLCMCVCVCACVRACVCVRNEWFCQCKCVVLWLSVSLVCIKYPVCFVSLCVRYQCSVKIIHNSHINPHTYVWYTYRHWNTLIDAHWCSVLLAVSRQCFMGCFIGLIYSLCMLCVCAR